ncbi:polysaccharide deacetylase family protein [Iodobacter sp. CM08]|uniref:polysaccharide deacetylase family protein n=1 Tax=Iodobacter sp. CM08 TaxID=3085902 RepID=UPI0029821772|nr:polysaccharide deacetylase family protein [Iodobacter sp. CM08]MDW5416685.1 polysaccharide deacetylase family protein [Iodobacter sp. CM08]
MLILTSWDDGHPKDLRLADLLIKYGLKATFFIPIENREGREVLSASQIKLLDQNFEIAGHTLTHRYLQGLPEADLRYEIEGGKLALENIVGHDIHGFCYPGGKYDSKVINAVKQAGFSYARTVENLQFDLGHSAWAMPTSLQFYPHSALVLFKNIVKKPELHKLQPLFMRLSERNFFKFLEKQLERISDSDAVFHLWGHSWEIEAFDLWKELELFLSLLAQASNNSLTLFDAQLHYLNK